MARLIDWLSPGVMHALGFTLIHSLWQAVGLAALAAAAMAFSRRPPVRYVLATTALIAMLAAPLATFFLLLPAPVAHTDVAAPPLPRPVLAPPDTTKAETPPSVMPKALRANMAFGGEAARQSAMPAEDSATQFWPALFVSPDLLPPIMPWLVAAWLCGVIFFSLRFGGGLLLLEMRRRSESRVPPAPILALCHALQRQMGLGRAIRYLECSWLEAPAVVGWLSPIVFLPVRALTGLSEAQLKAVIAHELAHIRRLDALVNLLQILVETLLFYHPAVWWLSARIRAERELCCDEIAIALTGERLEYARALTLIAKWAMAPKLAMAAHRGPLSRRVLHILGQKPSRAGGRLLGVTGSILFLTAALGAANALFGIAYPIPTAHAEARLEAALPVRPLFSGEIVQPVTQARVVGGHLAVTKPDLARVISTEPMPELVALNDATVAPSAPSPTQIVAANDQPVAPVETPIARPGCAAPKLINSMPMTDVPGSNTMTVAATIEGRPANLLIGIADTTQLWNRTAATLDLPVREGARMMDGGGRFSEDVSRIQSLTIGAMRTGYFVTHISPDPEYLNSSSDGVLGTDMMMRYDIDLDFAHRQMNYFSPEQCEGAGVYWAPGKVTAVKMAAYAEVVFVPITLDGQTIVAALDTTADKSFINPAVARKLFGLTADPSTPDSVRDSGALIRAEMHRFSSLTFGGLTFSNPEIAVPVDGMTGNTREFHAARNARNSFHLSEFLPDMVIGMDVLRQTHLYISFQNRRIYVSPAGDGETLRAGPVATSWFNVWKYGYDTYLYPGKRPFFSL